MRDVLPPAFTAAATIPPAPTVDGRIQAQAERPETFCPMEIAEPRETRSLEAEANESATR
jgi:hypothetical protein